MKSFHIENFGCRAARADGEAVGDRLRNAGMDEGESAKADVVVVNTCSVTAEADRAARAFIRRAHRVNPDARILVTGCYAQRAPEELAGLDGVAAVVGNSHKAMAPSIALELAVGSDTNRQSEPTGVVPLHSLLTSVSESGARIWADDRFAHSFLEEAQLLPGEQTRPNLKIQEGCSNRCTFCVIPQTRGSSRSLAPEAIVRQVNGFVAAGGQELVFSGINLGRWGRDLVSESSKNSLAGLVRQILTESDLARLRLSSIEPMDWDSELIGLLRGFGGTRLARHAHLPLQSGSDTVLRRMHRRYRPWHYEQKVGALIDAAGPYLTLGADVMAGFPGETDREFEETVEFIRALPFGYLHLFPFSPRPGTRGWALHAESPVPAAVVDERMAVLRKLIAEKSETHRRWFVGRKVEAITLRTPPALQGKGRTCALTDNFLPAEIDALLPANRLVQLRVASLDADLTLRTTVESAEYCASPVSAMSL
ncbi:MAG TPA: MiaB/RimO family radical SAM methylthiotransferase [Terracidiphilus sp.]|jgi:threonylcarbamoyladenosine tRNA methylthiotransferase MtaB